jgi:hypothetical protein
VDLFFTYGANQWRIPKLISDIGITELGRRTEHCCMKVSLS